MDMSQTVFTAEADHGRVKEVRLDGKVIEQVHYADTEKGIVKVYELDKYTAGMDSVPVKVLEGKVEVVLIDENAAP